MPGIIRVAQIVSDETHYRPFVCTLCQNLVGCGSQHGALDSSSVVVTSRCSHAFCRTCLEEWVIHQRHKSGGRSSTTSTDTDSTPTTLDDENNDCTCPTCQTALHEDPSLGCMELLNNNSSSNSQLGVGTTTTTTTTTIAARPLQEAQPLAFQLLLLVQVTCCDWKGSYGEYMATHAAHCQGESNIHNTTNNNRALSPLASNSANATTTPLIPNEGVSPNPISMDALQNPKNNNNTHQRWFSNGSIAQAPMLNGKAPAPAPLQAPALFSSGGTATTNGIGTTATTTATTTTTAATNGLGGAFPRDTPPNLVKRTKSLNPNAADVNHNHNNSNNIGDGPNNGTRVNNATKTVPEDKPLKRRTSERKFSLNDSINDLDNSQANNTSDPHNQSINSLQGWGEASFSEGGLVKPLETLTEDNWENSSVVTADAEKVQQTVEQAEKLKKQANAKFNKGDFNAARTLYTNGINLMAGIPRRGDMDGELLSNMHSNRAVTYFREKEFDRCVEDCNMAIQYDKTYEKSWIRKWRALMALGIFEDAFACLEQGAETVSNPSKIKKELAKAREEMEMLRKCRRLLEESNYGAVRDALRSFSRSSDNIGLLHMAALADCGLGNAENALEKANKALRFNPNQADGLAIRGYALFLSGDTEKGTSLIQDAHGRDKENKRIKKDYQRCSKTHSLLCKGRSCVKRGRYLEAIEHFTGALKECGTISANTVLYGMLRSERAEAWMLSDKYLEALKDCQEVISAQRENAAAWTVRAEVLIALGKAEEAKKELMLIRKTWGADNQTIEEGYRRVDFELRVLKADRELMRFIKELDRGLVPEGGVVPELELKEEKKFDRRALMERAASRRGLGDKQVSSRRLLQETQQVSSNRRLDRGGALKSSSRNLMENVESGGVALKQKSSRNLMDSGGGGGLKQKSSRNLMDNGGGGGGLKQKSSRNLMGTPKDSLESGQRPPSRQGTSGDPLATSAHVPGSSKNLLDGEGKRPSSSRRLRDKDEVDRRNAMRKTNSSRQVLDSKNGSSFGGSNGPKQKQPPANGLDRKSMSERNFDTNKPRPPSVKRT